MIDIDDETWIMLKWIFFISNIILSLFFFSKMKHYNNYKDLITKHHLNPNKDKVCFIIAHPDDEAMFFIPSINSLYKDGKELSIICLSNGNYDGLGKIREKELQKSCIYLGFTNIHLINHVDLMDGPNEKWSEELIADIVEEYLINEKYGTLITFDEYGISKHPNHISVYKGIKVLYNRLNNNQQNIDKELPPFQVFTLNTTNIIRKYISFIDIIFSMWDPLVYTCYKPWISYFAMNSHYSQFVWFRKLFIIFSRYGYINTLHPMIE